MVKKLKDHIETFKKSRNLIDGVETYDAESIQELSNVFRLVSKVPKATGLRPAKPHPYPIITKIQIQQDNTLLNAGVILADTPGVTDSNQAVVDATSNYLRKAGTVLVFESFKRIADSETLDANLRECIRLGKIHDTHLVVTMIDNGQTIKAEDRVELAEEDRERLESAEQVVLKLKTEEKDLKQAKVATLNESISTSAGYEELRKLESALEKMPIKVALAEAKVGQVAIEIRTREVANELKGKLRKLERSKNAPDLPVHFISNTQYQKHMTGYEATKPPVLDVEGTGIPGLRRMLYGIPARGKKTTLTRIGRNHLPAIFNGILGILTKTSLERKKEVEKVIIDVLGRYPELAENIMDELTDMFVRRVVSVIGEFC